MQLEITCDLTLYFIYYGNLLLLFIRKAKD